MDLHKCIKPIFQPKVAAIAWLALVGCLLLCLGLYLSFTAPDDYLQGTYARIMYIHIPFAWLAIGLYALMAILSIFYIIWKVPLYDIIAKSICPIGSCLTFTTLLSGSIWGMPTWGTWWVWDARLTSMLILLFIYIGCSALRNSFKNKDRGAIASSYFAALGLVNLPIIKFSVNIWNTLHQPASLIRVGGPAIHHSMLPPLFVMLLAFMVIIWVLIALSVHTEQLKRKYTRCITR